jgi:hypothetical protein
MKSILRAGSSGFKNHRCHLNVGCSRPNYPTLFFCDRRMRLESGQACDSKSLDYTGSGAQLQGAPAGAFR